MAPPAARLVRSASIGAALASLLVAVACDPVLSLRVQLPAGVAAEDVVLRVAVFAPVAEAVISCDQIAFGDVDQATLFSSRLFEGALDADGGALGDVPRQGNKLVTVDGTDETGGRAVAGCAEAAPFDPRHAEQEVVIALVRTGELAFEPPTALVVAELPAEPRAVDPSDGTTLAAVELLLSHGGEPIDGAVRVSRLDADGASTPIGVVGVQDGRAAVPLGPAPPGGPFQLVARARFARGGDPTPLSGLAWYGNTAAPVPGLADALRIVPAPASFSDGTPAAGAFLVDRSEGDLRQLRVAAVSPGAPGTAPEVELSDRGFAAGAEGDGLVGVAIDEAGRARALLDVNDIDPQCGLGGGADPCLVAFAPGAADQLTPLDGNLLPSGVPVGACGTADTIGFLKRRLAAVDLQLYDADDGSLTAATLTESGLAMPLGALRLDAAACGVDGSGAAHRLVKASTALGSLSFSVLVDVGSGATGSAVPVALVELPGLLPGAAIATDRATGEVLLGVARSDRYEVNRYLVGSGALRLSATVVELPFPPAAIATGSFSAPGASEAAILAVPEPVEGAAPPPALLVIAGTVDGAVIGERTFDCAAAADCRLFAADVDGDGVDELLVGSIAADGGRHADVLRFFP